MCAPHFRLTTKDYSSSPRDRRRALRASIFCFLCFYFLCNLPPPLLIVPTRNWSGMPYTAVSLQILKLFYCAEHCKHGLSLQVISRLNTCWTNWCVQISIVEWKNHVRLHRWRANLQRSTINGIFLFKERMIAISCFCRLIFSENWFSLVAYSSWVIASVVLLFVWVNVNHFIFCLCSTFPYP